MRHFADIMEMTPPSFAAGRGFSYEERLLKDFILARHRLAQLGDFNKHNRFGYSLARFTRDYCRSELLTIGFPAEQIVNISNDSEATFAKYAKWLNVRVSYVTPVHPLTGEQN